MFYRKEKKISKHYLIRQILKDVFCFVRMFTEQTLGLVDISMDSASVVKM